MCVYHRDIVCQEGVVWGFMTLGKATVEAALLPTRCTCEEGEHVHVRVEWNPRRSLGGNTLHTRPMASHLFEMA
jgi:hypothetical protein